MLSYKFTKQDMQHLAETVKHHQSLFLIDAAHMELKMRNTANIEPSAQEQQQIETFGTRTMSDATHTDRGFICLIGKDGQINKDVNEDNVAFTYIVEMSQHKKEAFEHNLNQATINAMDAIEDEFSNTVLVPKPEFEEKVTDFIPKKIYQNGRMVDNVNQEPLVIQDVAITHAENGLPQPKMTLERATKTVHFDPDATFNVRFVFEKIARVHRPVVDITNALLGFAMVTSAMDMMYISMLALIMSGLSWAVLEGFPFGRTFKRTLSSTFKTMWNLMLFAGLMMLLYTLWVIAGGLGVGIIAGFLLLFRTGFSVRELYKHKALKA